MENGVNVNRWKLGKTNRLHQIKRVCICVLFFYYKELVLFIDLRECSRTNVQNIQNFEPLIFLIE